MQNISTASELLMDLEDPSKCLAVPKFVWFPTESDSVDFFGRVVLPMVIS
jgi:hypothetical protein